MPLSKPYYHIITEKLWPESSGENRKKLFELLIAVTILQVASIVNLGMELFAAGERFCLICDIGLVLFAFLAITCLLNSKINCALNTFFTVPVFVYAYYISDFSIHIQPSETVYYSVGWLLAGAFVLFYFAESESKIILYSIVSVATVVFQLLKANQFFGQFNGASESIPHPLVALILIFGAGFFLRRKYLKIVKKLSENLKATRTGISKVVRETGFPVAEIKATRDEEGNVVNLKIEKVNNSFESLFNIQLYEVKEQEANYIFELVLKENFDLNKLVLFDNNKTKEFYATKLELWFKIHILKPDPNTFFVIFEDITKEKKKLAELENSKKRYKVLLEAIPDMFFVIGKDGTYEDFVVKESDLYKLEDANIVGSTIFDVGFPENMADKILKCIQSCLRNNSIEAIEYSLATPNGTYLFEMRLAKLSPRSVISVARDITRRKNAEFDLERAKKKAEESDRLKSAFLANLSHEIRTPLNIITNFTRMLAEGGLGSSERTELSDAISQNGTQLLNMIDNTIHLSKIETDSVDLIMNFCPVNSLVRDIYNHYRPLIPDGRQVRMSMNQDVPNSSFGFVTDRRLLLETMQILVDNAVKYTKQGEIHLGYEMLGTDAVRFIVSDTGIGIPKDELENIFSRFYRIRNEINDVTSGSGIGLSIAQHYIQLLGGELHLESTPGKGSTFSFDLPFREGKGFLRVVS
ncbi:PAS domain S-box-containing protein [Mariniphaga anaerophila]|uniref:histidine kinase n=1 Tax=Mariniphaga anaerophila TaxID=1484053 RepID=A0A1M4XU01_9BACT|nr:PAS domain-containing sensor histidine kinase [Mariniphaga anaerophila]SHE97057.1 PAS domain S-box-containing protein [Mariniphaga anaerophila]